MYDTPSPLPERERVPPWTSFAASPFASPARSPRLHRRAPSADTGSLNASSHSVKMSASEASASPGGTPLSTADRTHLNKLMTLSLSHLSALRRSTGAITHSQFVLYPSNPFRYYWDIYILLLLVYVALVSVVLYSFMGLLRSDSAWFWIERFLDVSFAVDIILNFFTSYKTIEMTADKAPVTVRTTAIKYLTTYFLFDLVATIPWDTFNNSRSGQLSLLNLFRFLRLLRLFKLFRLLRLLRTREEFTLFEVKLRMKYGYIRLAGLFIMVALICHWIACLFYFFGSVPNATNNPLFESWAEDVTKVPADGYGRYMMALYFSIYTVTTIGYGDVVPGTTLERTYVAVIMVLGAACFAYVISQVSNIFGELNESSATHHRMMDALTDLARIRHLPESLVVEIRLFLQHYFSYRRVAEEKALLDVMGNGLRQRVLRHMYGDYLSDTQLFASIAENHLDAVYCAVKEEFKHKDDVLFDVGDAVDALYIVKRGAVELTDGTGERVTVNDGGVIGAADMAVQRQRNYKATVTANSEVLCVPRDAIVRALRSNDEVWGAMRDEEASVLWAQSFQVAQRNLRFARMASTLRERYEQGLRDSGQWMGDDNNDGDDDSEDGGDDGPQILNGESTESSRDVAPQQAQAHARRSVDWGGVELMRRELGEKTEKIRVLESRLGDLQRQLHAILSNFQGSA